MTGRPGPFVGRALELSTLSDALARVVGGAGSAVVVDGEAGIGKSRLVDQALRAAGDLQIHRTACGELERDIPFAGIAAALDLRRSSDDPRKVALAELIGGSSDAGNVRFRIVEEIVDLLERLALHRPVVLVLDDLHRADPGTLLVAKRLIRGIDVLPVGLVCTLRPHPRPAEVVDAIEGATVVRLEPLPPEDVRGLVAELLGAEPGPGLLTALDGCAGNPLYVSELVIALRDDGRIPIDDETVELKEGGLPATLRLTILGRLAVLSAEVISLLRVAACFGSTFDVRDLAIVTQRSAAELLVLLDDPLRSGVVVEAGQRLAFRHDLVRDVTYEDIPESVRTAIHADIARRLREAGRSATEVASHVLRSAADGDAGSIDLLREAARDALPLSAVAAGELLEHAAKIARSTYPESQALTVELASALSASGRQEEAESLVRRILDAKPDLATAQRARGVLVHTLMVRDRAREAVDVLEAMASAEGVSGGERARLLAHVARAWAQMGDWERAGAAGPEALELAETAGDDNARCQALLALAWTAGVAGEWTELLERTVAAADVVRRGSTDPATGADVAWLYLFAFGVLLPLREDATTLVRTELRRSEEAGHLWIVPMLHEILGFQHLRWGELDEAAVAARTAISAAEDLGSARFLSSAYGTLARVSVYFDDLESAERFLDAADGQIAHEDLPTYSGVRVWPAWAEFYEARGQPEKTIATLFQAYHELQARRGLLLFIPHFPRLVRHLLDAGHTVDARALLRELEEEGRSLPGGGHSTEAFVLQTRALVESDPELALAAIQAHRELGWGFFALLIALDDAAAVLVSAGRSAEAVPLLEEALGLWQQVGAPGHIARVSARLRDLGVRRGVRGRRGRPSTGWEALTESELRVAGLVAEGLTYREIGERMFLSRRTVEGHVGRIFVKLGLSSRRELAVEAARRRVQHPVNEG
jgi:DNA-binding CsgD family transcriptional regulator